MAGLGDGNESAGQQLQEQQQKQLQQQQQQKQQAEYERSVPGDAAYMAELEQLQKVDFALVELTLYLDTHPTDMQAVQQFNQLAQKRAHLAHHFEMKYGPLMQFGHSFTRFPWQWSQAPWPWQV